MKDAGRYEEIVRAISSKQYENQGRIEKAIVLQTIEKAASSLVEAMDHLVEGMVASVANSVETSMRRVDDIKQRLANDIKQHFENEKRLAINSLLAEDRWAPVRWETIASEDILDLFRGPMADESLLFHEESSVETTVTYTLEREGRLIVVENVPARVDTETGEQSFSPQTEERLQEIDRGCMKPARVIEARVFDFAQSTSKPRQHLKVVRWRHLRGQGD